MVPAGEEVLLEVPQGEPSPLRRDKSRLLEFPRNAPPVSPVVPSGRAITFSLREVIVQLVSHVGETDVTGPPKVARKLRSGVRRSRAGAGTCWLCKPLGSVIP